jgi:hypothetical protein
MAERFRYRKSNQEFVIRDTVVPTDDSGQLVGPWDLVADGSLSSLMSAFVDDWHQWNHDGGKLLPFDVDGEDDWGQPLTTGGLQVSMADFDDFDDEYSTREPFEISYWQHIDAPVIDITVGVHGLDIKEQDFAPLLDPPLTRLGAVYVDTAMAGAGNQGYARIRVSIARRGLTVRDAKTISDAVEALVSRAGSGPFDAESGLDLIRAGRVDLLVGMTESSWLEAKSEAHNISEDTGRIELAKDVARFANSDTSALLVIGPVTKKKAGTDTIVSIKASQTRYATGKFARAIDRTVFPPIEGLAIENATVGAADGSGGYVMVIHVPAQAEELKPFLVHGAIAGGKVEGAFISIVRRRGEESIPVRPESIHSTLAAGRALLRGETAKAPTEPH